MKEFAEYLKHGSSFEEALSILDISLTPEFISSLFEKKRVYFNQLLESYLDNSDQSR